MKLTEEPPRGPARKFSGGTFRCTPEILGETPRRITDFLWKFPKAMPGGQPRGIPKETPTRIL